MGNYGSSCFKKKASDYLSLLAVNERNPFIDNGFVFVCVNECGMFRTFFFSFSSRRYYKDVISNYIFFAGSKFQLPAYFFVNSGEPFNKTTNSWMRLSLLETKYANVVKNFWQHQMAAIKKENTCVVYDLLCPFQNTPYMAEPLRHVNVVFISVFSSCSGLRL